VIVLDASVLIAYLDGTDDHHEAAEALLASAVDDDLGVNALTLAEVLVVLARTGRLDTVLSVLRDLDVERLPCPADTAVRFADRRQPRWPNRL
jgi:predicted nucleic acid-binding protein